MICASLLHAMNMDASLELVKLLRKTIKLVLYKAVVNYSNKKVRFRIIVKFLMLFVCGWVDTALGPNCLCV